MTYLQWVFWAVGLGLQYLTLAALLGGGWRALWPVAIYLGYLLITTVAEILFAITNNTHIRPYIVFYYVAEFGRQTALYTVVISLVLKILPPSRMRGTLIRLLVALAVLFWAGSVWIHHDPYVTRWMNPVIRNLSFSSAIANMILWLTMIASERRDNQLLMITGALGIQMTGDAIGQSLITQGAAQQQAWIARSGQVIAVVTHFLCLYVWWKAFQQKSSTHAIPAEAS